MNHKPTRYLRRKVVAEMVGVSPWCIWKWAKSGDFPLPYQLNPNGGRNSAVAWRQSEVEAWMETRPLGFGKPTPQQRPGRPRKYTDKEPK